MQEKEKQINEDFEKQKKKLEEEWQNLEEEKKKI